MDVPIKGSGMRLEPLFQLCNPIEGNRCLSIVSDFLRFPEPVDVNKPDPVGEDEGQEQVQAKQPATLRFLRRTLPRLSRACVLDEVVTAPDVLSASP
jgi:hypothetical protein